MSAQASEGFVQMPPGVRGFKSATLHIGYAKALPAHMREGVRELTSLLVPLEDRRQGFATSLMQRVCSEADGALMVLMIHVKPFDEEGITDTTKLCAFYERFGFKRIQTEPAILMARMPRPARPNFHLAAAIRQALH